MRTDRKSSQRSDKKAASRGHKPGAAGYSKKSALLEDAITQMNAGKYGRSSAALKELLALDPLNMEARRLFATLHLRLGNLIPARQAFDSLVNEAFERQDYWLAESLLREYLAAGPRCVPFLEKLGTIYQDKGDAQAAVTEYGKALDILVEDPDSDHPQLAAQLYAKVRELAPASPVAFRLASFFDAQSGEMLVRANPPQPESVPAADADGPATVATQVVQELSPAVPAEAEPVASAVASPDPGAGSSTPVVDSTARSTSNETIASLSAEPIEPESSPVESGERVETAGTHGHAPAERPHDSHPGFAVVQSEEEQPVAEPAPADSPPSGVLDTSADTEPAAETPLGIAALTEPVPSAEPVPVEQPLHAGDSQNKMEESSVPEPDQSVPALAHESQKKAGFLWEAVIAKAWNFSGAQSSLDQKEDTPNVEIEAAEQSAAGSAASIPVTLPDLGEVQKGAASPSDAQPRTSISAEALAAPMPWDQVQDATIRIAPPPVTESTAIETGGETERSPLNAVVSDLSESSSDEAAAVLPEDAPVSSPVGIAPASSSVFADSLNEPVFRFAGDPTASSHSSEPIAQPISTDSLSVVASGAVTGECCADAVTETPSPDTGYSNETTALPAELPAGLAEIPVEHLNLSTLTGPELSTSPANDEPAPAVSSYEPSPMLEPSVHWKTGEVAVQTHRPASKKQQRSLAIEPEPEAVALPVESQTSDQPAPVLPPESVGVEPIGQSHAAASEPEAWVTAGDSIRFVESPAATDQSPDELLPMRDDSSPAKPVAAAVSAVDVLFDSTQRTARIPARERISPKSEFRPGAILNRIRIGIFALIGSCFSTTRALVTTVTMLAVLSVALLVLIIGAVGMAWLVMEEQPVAAYHNLTTVPQRFLTDWKNNGYLLMLGFTAPPTVDPVQAGYERKPDGSDALPVASCTGGRGPEADRASADVTKDWFGTSDPAAQFRRNQDIVKSLVNRNDVALGRYRQWLKMRFEDWGYGHPVSPHCGAILSAHRLYVADGFAQNQIETGLDRLETDMEAWRTTLSQARTLSVKTMALQAINDDIAVAAGLLIRPEADGALPDRLARMLRPLDQMELSLRWPMQSQFVVATRTVETRLKVDRMESMPWHIRIASTLSLPKQRYFNDYARYYEASYKAAGEGRFGSLPKRASYIPSSSDGFSGLTDTLRNPLENLIGFEPLAEWEFYSGLVVDTDARLRLASLQVWLRRAPPGANLMGQIAKAGQGLYDPYTGFPMLVNRAKNVIYSVGHDGRDQDGHPQADVTAAIPPGLTQTARIDPNASGLK